MQTFTHQLVRIMKLTAFFLTVAFLHAGAKGVSQDITFRGKDVSLEKVFDVIKKQTGYVFFYDKDDVDKASLVTIDLKKASLEKALTESLKFQPLSYTI